MLSTLGLAVADEAHQLPALSVRLEPQRPAHHEVLFGRGPQRAHDWPPGHGRASTRNRAGGPVGDGHRPDHCYLLDPTVFSCCAGVELSCRGPGG